MFKKESYSHPQYPNSDESIFDGNGVEDVVLDQW